ncbi:MAG: hypothetical protein R3272_14615 [Candidatus Promineifilaceae bacterium]|nr:hypothetical protein [Candidatus Promineifilaceae bacterium]
MWPSFGAAAAEEDDQRRVGSARIESEPGLSPLPTCLEDLHPFCLWLAAHEPEVERWQSRLILEGPREAVMKWGDAGDLQLIISIGTLRAKACGERLAHFARKEGGRAAF